MQNGLAFNGNRADLPTRSTYVHPSTGKYVLKDIMGTAEVFELLSVGVDGCSGPMRIRLRSTYSGLVYELENFWKVRPAFPNEAQANARQGSDQFVQYWAANSQQYY